MVEISVMAALAALALLLLWSEGVLQRGTMAAWGVGGVLLALGIRWFVLPYDTAEGALLLAQWAAFFRSGGGFGALASPGCPYPLALQYFLALTSWVEYPALYLMKYLIFFAEIVLAWGCLRLASRFTKKHGPRLAVFLLVFLLPSGIINGGYAARGESLWCAFAVLAAERALADRPWQAVMLWALGLCFGSGAVLLLPVFLVLLFRGRMRPYHLLTMPAVFAAVIAPALWPDRPLGDVLLLFPPLSGLGERAAFQGSPGIYAVGDGALSPLVGLGAFAAFCAVLVWWLCMCGKRAEDQTLAAALAFTGASAAMLLPWMGEDSLYAAEALCLVLCAVSRGMIPAAVCCSVVSLLAFCAAQFGGAFFPLAWGAVILLAVMVMLTIYMYKHAYRKSPRSRRR